MKNRGHQMPFPFPFIAMAKVLQSKNNARDTHTNARVLIYAENHNNVTIKCASGEYYVVCLRNILLTFRSKFIESQKENLGLIKK